MSEIEACSVGVTRLHSENLGTSAALEKVFTSLSHQSAGVLQACPTSVKGWAWPLHPIRLLLISLFFRVEERDEGRHWALWKPPQLPPPLFYPATHPPAVALSVALEELWLLAKKKKKPILTTHLTHMHTLKLASRLEKWVATKCSSWPDGNAIGAEFLKGHLKSSLKVIPGKFSPLWLQTGRGKFHCRFYRL